MLEVCACLKFGTDFRGGGERDGRRGSGGGAGSVKEFAQLTGLLGGVADDALGVECYCTLIWYLTVLYRR